MKVQYFAASTLDGFIVYSLKYNLTALIKLQ